MGDEIPGIRRLTWHGHDFVDNISNSGIWAKVKERTKDMPALGIKIVAELAEAQVKKHLGLP